VRKKIASYFKKAPIKATCLSFAIFFHLIFICSTCFSFSSNKKNAIKKPLVINTIKKLFAPKEKQIAAASTPAPKKQQTIKATPSKPAEKKQETPKPQKKEEVKRPPIVDKKIVPVKKNPKKQEREESVISQEILQEIEESIAKIEGKSDKLYKGRKLKVPTALPSLEIDRPQKADLVEEASSDLGYGDTLVAYLRTYLQLPEFGEVKIKLTLRNDGSVAKVVVLKTESERNRKHLEAHLPTIKFPRIEKQEQTFVLTFCNDI